MKKNIKSKALYDEEGNQVGIIIKYADFEHLIEELENLHDLYKIYRRKGKKEKTIPYEQLKKELFEANAKK